MPRRRLTVDDFAGRPGIDRGRLADQLRTFGLACSARDRRAIDKVRIANGARPLWNDPPPGRKPQR
jgi:hypothetical protein